MQFSTYFRAGALALAGGCAAVFGLARCAGDTPKTDDAGTASDGGATVCQDSGEGCPCDPATFVIKDCYTGALGTSGVGVCKVGKRSCDPKTYRQTACVGEVTPSPEICNLLDDDCNGAVDDVPAILEAGVVARCTSPACDPYYADASITCFGASPGICGAGTLGCGANQKIVCNEFIHAGAAEVCNGIDDDCNGAIDDGIGDLGSCEADASGQCATSQLACDDGGLVCPPASPSTETCDGIDNDCNGVVDDHACAGQKTNVYCCQHNSSYACTSTPNDGYYTNCHAAL